MDKSTERDRLAAIKARVDATTAGKWTAWDRGIGYEVHQAEGWPLNDGHKETFAKADAVFIAHAPEDVEFLLALVEEPRG